MSKYYHTPESAKEYVNLAQGYDGRELIAKLAQFLPKDSTVLELGSGPGVDLTILAEKFKVTGSDLSPVFLKIINERLPDIPLMLLDAVILKTDQTFDAIYSNKVLHHLTDDELKHSIKRQTEILNRDGIICHSFWKGEGKESFSGLLFNYHKDDELRELFGPAFEVLLLEKYSEMESGDSLLLIGKKK